MFILTVPMYSKQEINGDSNYVIISNMIHAMRIVRPDWHFIVVFPDAQSGYKYEDDGLFALPNVTRVPHRISPQKMSHVVSYNADWYNRLARTVGIDLVWCHQVEVAMHLSSIGENSFEIKARPNVVTAHHYVAHPKLPYVWERMSNVAFLQVGSSLLADWNVANSDFTIQCLIEIASLWLQDKHIDTILSKTSKIGNGTLAEDLAPLQFPENDVPVIIYNHRLQAYKNWEKTFDLLVDLWEEGLKFEVWYTSNAADNLAKIQHLPFLKIKLGATAKDYWDNLKYGDLNITNSTFEMFCISAVESMSLGQPLIAPNGVTFPEITGQEETGYPYLFDNRDQQLEHIRRLLTDKEERQKWGRILSDYVRKRYNRFVWASEYAVLFERLTDFQLGVQEDVRLVVDQVIRNRERLTPLDLKNEMNGTIINGRVPLSNQSFPLTKVIRLSRELGHEVIMSQGQQLIIAKS